MLLLGLAIGTSIGTCLGAFVLGCFAARAVRIADMQVEGAKRLRIQLVDFCDRNNIEIRPWDVPPFAVVYEEEDSHYDPY